MESIQISSAEWEVMRVAWTQGQTTSKEISSILSEKMGWKLATIKTFIGRLVDKGMLETEKDGRKYIYSPTISEEETVLDSANKLLNQVCNKKTGHILAEIVDQATLSQEDLKEIQEVINKKMETAPESVACDCVTGQCNCHKDNHTKESEDE